MPTRECPAEGRVGQGALGGGGQLGAHSGVARCGGGEAGSGGGEPGSALDPPSYFRFGLAIRGVA